MPDCLLCPQCDQPLAELDVACPQCGWIITPELPTSLVPAPRANGNAVSSHRADLDAKWAARRTASSSAVSLHRTDLDAKWLARRAALVTGTFTRGGQPARQEPPDTGNAWPRLRDITASQLQVDTQALPFISYALQHAGIGAVLHLKIKNLGYQASPNLLVSLSLQPDDYGQPWETNIPELEPGQTWERSNIVLPLNLDRLRRVVETERAALKVVVSTSLEVLYSGEPVPIRVHAYNEWVMLPGFLQLVAVFVQSNDKALQQIMVPAMDQLERTAGTRSFSGYQRGSASFVLGMLEAIHAAMLDDTRLGYRNPPPSHEGTGQKLRLVSQTLGDRCGTCFDLAVLQAALWEHIGLAPVIVLVPGHALLACWMHSPPADRPAVVTMGQARDATGQVLAALNAGALLPLNSVEAADRNQRFEAAVQHGAAILQRALQSDGEVHFVDIEAARRRIKPLP